MKAQTIPPFPDEHGRESFANWLSGFADGEACFSLQTQRYERGSKPTCRGRFAIALRDDDAAVLMLIQSFWQCGSVTFSSKTRGTSTTKPFATLAVANFGELLTAVIPHFERYPLRAKKRGDFAIWKEGVRLAAAVADRPREWPRGARGSASRWKPDELDEFLSIKTRLSDYRRYRPGSRGSPGEQPGAPVALIG